MGVELRVKVAARVVVKRRHQEPSGRFAGHAAFPATSERCRPLDVLSCGGDSSLLSLPNPGPIVRVR